MRNERGFSLVESLIAVVLLTIGVLAWGRGMGAIVSRNVANERMSVAVALAEEKVEELRARAQTTTLNDADDGVQALVASGVTYTITTDVVNGGVGNLTNLNVTVTWPSNLSGTYTLNTLVHQ